jgi:predicted kinase
MQLPQRKLLILIGCPSSGKTTFRISFLKQNKDYVAVSRDDFRYMLRNEGWLERSMENIITDQVHKLIHDLLRDGKSVIVDATNVNEKYLNDYNQFLKAFPHIHLEYKVFDVPFEELLRRDAARERSVGRAVIEKMVTTFEELKRSKSFKIAMDLQNKGSVVQNERLQKCIIVDLDGTVALFDESGPHYRSPYDASRCDEVDYLSEPVAMAIRGFVLQGVECIFVSGREDKFEAQTSRFLAKHFSDINYSLFMRSSEREKGVDDRIIKERIFREHILPYYYTVACIDDRLKVLRMWHSLGLFTFNVNGALAEF